MKKPRTNFIFAVLIVAFVSFCLLSIIKLNIASNEKYNEKAELESNITALKDEVDGYTYELDIPMDEDYIKEQARDKLNLRLPEEIVFYNDLIN